MANAFWAQLQGFCDERPEAATADEFASDLLDFIRGPLGNPGRRGGPRLSDRSDTSMMAIDIPPGLDVRERKWVADELARSQQAVGFAREDLGFDGVPYPGNVVLSDEFWQWADSRQRPETFEEASGLLAPSEDLKQALLGLRPRVNSRSPQWTEEEIAQNAFDAALRRLTSETDSLSSKLGCTPKAAARWILAAVAPVGACMHVKITKHNTFRDSITLTIDPDVVTPEEVRTIYRRSRTSLTPSSDDRLRRFISHWTLGNAHRSNDEQFKLWNSMYPLNTYKSAESYRVAVHRASKSGSAPATVQALRPLVDDSRPTLRGDFSVKW